MPTVEQIWRAMPPLTGLVAGGSGIYNEVSWVVTLRPTPPGFDSLRGKELALVDMATTKTLDITLAYLITTLSRQGVSALGILGEVPPADREVANKNNMPVLQLPVKSDLNTLEKQITALIQKEREHLYHLEQELTQQLMETTLAGQGVDTILQKLKDLTGRDSICLNLDYSPISPDMKAGLPDIQNILPRLFTTAPSSIVGVKLSNDYSGFLSPIIGKQGTEGYLLVVTPASEIQEADRVTVKVGALSLAIEISRQQAVEDTEDKFQVEMVESLLNGELSTVTANERASRLGLDLSQPYVVIAMQISGSGRELLTARKAAALFKKALCHRHGSTLIVIYPVAANLPLNDLRRLGREISQKSSAYLRTAVSLGVGRAYTGAAGLRASFQEAERSLSVGQRLFGEGSCSFFGDLGVYRLLLSVNSDELKSFYHDFIEPLADYDRQHGGDLLHTLEVTLHDPTLSETAKTLHVHRNTLLYRLQRIQEITNLNLDDGEIRLAMYLALRVGEVIRAG